MPSNPTDPAVEAAARALTLAYKTGAGTKTCFTEALAAYLSALPATDAVSRAAVLDVVLDNVAGHGPGSIVETLMNAIRALPSVPLAGGAGWPDEDALRVEICRALVAEAQRSGFSIASELSLFTIGAVAARIALRGSAPAEEGGSK